MSDLDRYRVAVQIDEQLAELAATGTRMRQSPRTFEVAGEPDMHCFVDAPLRRIARMNPKRQLWRWLWKGRPFQSVHPIARTSQDHSQFRAHMPVSDTTILVRNSQEVAARN
jgi:hypothetical protein